MAALTAILLAFAGTGGGAQPPAREQWVAVFSHSEGGISAYDPASIERDGDRVRVWVLWDRSDVADSPFREGRLYNELDCAGWTGRILSYRALRADGSVAAERDTPTPSGPLGPGTVGDALARALCSAAARDFPPPPPPER